MKEFAEKFYNSTEWKKCRTAYRKKVGGLCERCLKEGKIVPGVIVHHRIYISPEQIDNPEVTLNFQNLELLCRSCHEQEHSGKVKRYTVDEMGRVSIL